MQYNTKFKFKGLKNTRNCHSSQIRSKNDSLTEEEKGQFKSRFDTLEAINDNEEHKLGQVTSLETQELLLAKLQNLEIYSSGMASVEMSDKKHRQNHKNIMSISNSRQSSFSQSGANPEESVKSLSL